MLRQAARRGEQSHFLRPGVWEVEDHGIKGAAAHSWEPCGDLCGVDSMCHCGAKLVQLRTRKGVGKRGINGQHGRLPSARLADLPSAVLIRIAGMHVGPGAGRVAVATVRHRSVGSAINTKL